MNGQPSPLHIYLCQQQTKLQLRKASSSLTTGTRCLMQSWYNLWRVQGKLLLRIWRKTKTCSWDLAGITQVYIHTFYWGGRGGRERHTNIRFDKTRRNQKRARPRGYGLHFLASYKTALLSSASLAQTILMARQSSTSILPRLLQIQWSLPAHMVLLSPFRWIEYDQISTVVHLRGFSSLSFFLFSLSLSNQPINPRKIETAYEFPSSSSSTCNRSKADRNKTQNIQTPMRLEHSSAVEASSITRISAISKRGQGFFTRRIFPLFFFKKKRVSALHTRNI